MSNAVEVSISLEVYPLTDDPREPVSLFLMRLLDGTPVCYLVDGELYWAAGGVTVGVVKKEE